jgi:Fur family ferric uptake transcriptional regulator
MTTRLEDLCKEKGLKMTGHRRLIARVLSESTDHPDVETLFQRAARLDSNISIATVYRTVHLFEEVGVLERHAFRDGKARYEERPESHHDHLIDMRSGAVVEFKSEAIEKMQERVAGELGYRLIGHRLELYAVQLEKAEKPRTAPPSKPAKKPKTA